MGWVCVFREVSVISSGRVRDGWTRLASVPGGVMVLIGPQAVICDCSPCGLVFERCHS